MVMTVKLLKKTAAIVMALAVTLCACIRYSDASAASAGADIKGRTVSQALKMDGAAYMNWLLSHEHDNYYLGTPYEPWDRRNPNGDCKGANGWFDEPGIPGMNCMGFIWHVLYKATDFSNGNVDDVELAMSRLSFYRGLNITRRYFANKQAMLNSGYLEKGDIIWMILDQDEDSDSPYHHTGIYWGDGHSDLMWHSNRVTGGQGECNAISKILPEVDRNTMYIVLKVGAKTLSKPKLTCAVNTGDGIRITWDKVDGAAKYRVFQKAAVGWKSLGDTTATSFTYTGAAEGEELTFTVRCVTACGKGYTSMFDSKGVRCRRHSPTAAYIPATETFGDYEYTVLEDGTAQITRCKSTASELTIPTQLGGYGVSGIGAYAFADCTGLKQATVPDSVTRIGGGAFGWKTVGDMAVPADGFTICGYTGSEAENYADLPDNSFITFVSQGSCLVGDADADGKVRILDATRIRRYLAALCAMDGGAYTDGALSANEMKRSDTDGDGQVTILDATTIQRLLASLPAHESDWNPVT